MTVAALALGAVSLALAAFSLGRWVEARWHRRVVDAVREWAFRLGWWRGVRAALDEDLDPDDELETIDALEVRLFHDLLEHSERRVR